jgi:hypothetical protein
LAKKPRMSNWVVLDEEVEDETLAVCTGVAGPGVAPLARAPALPTSASAFDASASARGDGRAVWRAAPVIVLW